MHLRFEKKSVFRCCIIGGATGLGLPSCLFLVFSILNSFGIAFGENPATSALVIAIALLEIPIALVGRSIGLPIESGGDAFILFDFNTLGYVLVDMYWMAIGILTGGAWGLIRSCSKK